MRKLSLLALVAFVSGAAFAQDAPAVKRTFRAYMDVISGNMIAADATNIVDGNLTTMKPAGKVWAGNEYEIGLVYGQNWAKAPWLTTTFALKAVFNPEWVNATDGTSIGRTGNVPSNAQVIRGQFGLDFSKYFSFYMDSRLLMGFTTQYAWSSGAHSLAFQLGLELFAGNYSLSGDKYKNIRQSALGAAVKQANHREGAAGPIIDAVWLDIAWTAKMPMGFANTILIRPVGFSGDNGSEVAERFYIRLQETLSWSNAGFSIYARVRYNIKNIAFPSYTVAGSDTKWKSGIVHDLSLRAGLSYAYDFSKL